jgi:hypothetical protein
MLQAVLLLLSAAAANAALPSLAGPPAICFPLDIGDARSLAWGGENAFDADPEFPLEKLVPETLAILEGSKDALVHAETLRRAVIYSSGAEQRKKDPNAKAQCAALIQALQRRVIDAELAAEKQKIEPHARALCWMDLGFALGAYEQIGAGKFAPPAPPLERATELAPKDGGVALAVWLAAWTHDVDPAQHKQLLADAVRLADDPKGLVRRNLMNVAGHFLGVESYDQLAAKVRASDERGG